MKSTETNSENQNYNQNYNQFWKTIFVKSSEKKFWLKILNRFWKLCSNRHLLYYSICQSFGGNFWWKLIIKIPRILNEGHLRFLDSKKVEIIEKNDTRTYTTSVLNVHLIRADPFKAQSLIIRREIIGSRYLK